jgi:hypothetical protein
MFLTVLAVIRRKEELVVVMSRRGDQILVRRSAPIACHGDLVRLEAVHDHRQLSLIALHHGYGRAPYCQ